jgi:hypothetical protein
VKKSNIIGFVCLALLAAFPLYAKDRDTTPLTFTSVRALGMGGTPIASTDGPYTLWANPAEYANVAESSIFDLNLNMGDFKKTGTLMGAVSKASKGNSTGIFKSISDLVGNKGTMGLDFNLTGPISFGSIHNGMGWGVFDRAGTTISMVNGNVSMRMLMDLAGNFGYGWTLLDFGKGKLDVGANVKPFVRINSAKEGIPITSLLGSDALDKLGMGRLPLYIGATSSVGTSVHLDLHGDLGLGLMLDNIFNFDVKAANLKLGNSSVSNEYRSGFYAWKPRLNLGVSYTIPDLLAIMDLGFYTNFNDVSAYMFTPAAERYKLDDFRKNVNMGAEATFFDMLSVRLGIADWMLSCGVGIDLFKNLSIDLALYGKELGNKIGTNPIPMFAVSLSWTPNLKPKVSTAKFTTKE